MIRSRCRSVVLALSALAVCAAMTAASSSAALPEFEEGKEASLTGHPPPLTFASTWGAWVYSDFGASFSGEMRHEPDQKRIFNATFNLTEGGAYGCSQAGSKLVLPGLTGRLGYINKANKEVGMRFEPPKEPIASCNLFTGGTWQFAGGVIAHITPVNEFTKHFTLRFYKEGGGVSNKQSPLWFEGEAEKKFPSEAGPLSIGHWGCKVFFEVEHCEFAEGKATAIEGNVEFETPKAIRLLG